MSTPDHGSVSDTEDWNWLNELCRATPTSLHVGALADATAAERGGTRAFQNSEQEGASDDDTWLLELCRAPLGSASVAAGDDAPRLHESRSATTAGVTACPQLPPTAVRVAQSQLSQNYGPVSRSTH